MAKYQGEKKSGKMGDKIYTSYLGNPYVRRMPESVANPRTEAQQAHRNAFVAISRLASDLKEVHLIGLHKHAQRQKPKLNTFSDFKKLNKDCCVGGVISYCSVIVSKGPVDDVNITSVELDEQHVLHVAFGCEVTDKNKGDLLGLFVYCPELRACHALKPVLRTAEVVTESLPEEFAGHELHLYGFLQDKKLRTSDTLYVAIPVANHIQSI